MHGRALLHDLISDGWHKFPKEWSPLDTDGRMLYTARL